MKKKKNKATIPVKMMVGEKHQVVGAVFPLYIILRFFQLKIVFHDSQMFAHAVTA